jgi:DNA polymerase-3 subunit delta
LIDATGTDLRLLASEIDKLVTFVGAAHTIDVGSLEAVTGDTRETSAFELARLLTAGDLAGALRAWEKFAASGEYPGLALGALIHHVRQLWRIKALQATGATPERMASELGAPVFTVRRLSAQAAALEADRLRQWLEALCDADQLLKRSGLSLQTIFERLIVRFCVADRAPQTPR